MIIVQAIRTNRHDVSLKKINKFKRATSLEMLFSTKRSHFFFLRRAVDERGHKAIKWNA